MNKIKNIITHSVLNDFWVVLSRDPDNRKPFHMAHPAKERHVEVSSFFKTFRPLGNLQIQ